MILGLMGLSPIELLIVLAVFVLLVGAPLAGVVAVVVLIRRAAGRATPPAVAGEPTVVRSFEPADAPISDAAHWIGNELEVAATEPGPVRLFELPLPNIDRSLISYRFRIQTDDLRSKVYPEMWCRVVGVGECFSRGLDQKVHGTNRWLTVEIPFHLRQGQHADLAKLNLAFEGPGKVRLADIQVLATPLL